MVEEVAVRVAASMSEGLDAQTHVQKLKLTITNCQFVSNSATKSDLYSEKDYYYKLRSGGNGGAVYVYASPPSPLERDGKTYFTNCTFINNTASAQGGSLFLGPVLTATISGSYFETNGNVNSTRPRIGDILFASNSLTLNNTYMNVTSALSTTSVVYYQAADLLQSKLTAENVSLVCTEGFMLDHLNTTIDSGLQTLQLYCRPCRDGHYSIQKNSILITGIVADINTHVNCHVCPYGAACGSGLKNMDNFWGRTEEGILSMHFCPENYCEMDEVNQVAYSSCSENRNGTLCGECHDGFSEALFGTGCIANEQCGMWNYKGLMIIGGYGLLYLLFLMFEHDWVRFLKFLSLKMSTKTEIEIVADSNSDVSESGYFQIFMYFIQTASLLRVKIILNDAVATHLVKRPKAFLPEFAVDILEAAFDFDIPALQNITCFFASMQPVQKISMSMAFPFYLYWLLLMIYLLSGCCCIQRSRRMCTRSGMRNDHHRQCTIGGLGNDARMLATILSLLLYTFQGIAENMLLLVHCVEVEGRNVLFYDGNITCLQQWQYVVIGIIIMCILPFFVVLLFGPILLTKHKISVSFFFVSLIFPLFLAPVLMITFCRHLVQSQSINNSVSKANERPFDSCNSSQAGNNQRPRSDIIAGNTQRSNLHFRNRMITRFANSYPDASSTDRVLPITYGQNVNTHPRHSETRYKIQEIEQFKMKENKKKEITDTIVDLLTGPYRQDLLGGLCWEGMMNFRRLVLVVCFVFIPDRLVKQIALCLSCAVFLVMHITIKPFKQNYPNYAEAISLSLLLVVAVANLVRASFFSSGTIPMGDTYTVIVILEWVEIFCFTFLPLVIILIVLLAMCFTCGARVIRRRQSPSVRDIRNIPDGMDDVAMRWLVTQNKQTNDSPHVTRPNQSPSTRIPRVPRSNQSPSRRRHSSTLPDKHNGNASPRTESLLDRFYGFDDDENISRQNTSSRKPSRYAHTIPRPVHCTPNSPDQIRVTHLDQQAEPRWANDPRIESEVYY